MANTAYGNQNKTDVFRVVNTGSDYEIKQLDGITAATTKAHASLRLDKTVTFAPGFVAGALANPTWEQNKDNADFWALHKAVVTSAAVTGNLPEEIYADGSKELATTGGSQELLLVLHYGSELDGGKIKVFASLGRPNDDFGNYSESATARTKPSVGLQGVSAEYELDIKSLLDDTIVDAPAGDFKILANKCFVVEPLTKA